MQIEIKNLSANPAIAMRRAGYVFQHQEGNEMSFIRAFSRSGFPRFHAYLKTKDSGVVINFHYDMKKETYGEGTRHHGEYEGEQFLIDEAERLKKTLS